MLPDPRQVYSRQALLRDFSGVREIDLEGNYHPAEITRKISREFTRLGFHILEENTDIRKNPVGQATGETFGHVRAGASHTVDPAGHVTYFNSGAFGLVVALLAILIAVFILVGTISPFAVIFGLLLIVLLIYIVVNREKFFGKFFTYPARIEVSFAVGIPGEIYEDFRPATRNPIRTNVSVIIAGRSSSVRLATPEQERWIAHVTARHFVLPNLTQSEQYWNGRVAEVVAAMISGLEAARPTA